MKCESCQNEIKEEAIFCPICGNKVPKAQPMEFTPPPIPVDISEDEEDQSDEGNTITVIPKIISENQPETKKSSPLLIVLTSIFGLIILILVIVMANSGNQIKTYESQISSLKNEKSDLLTDVSNLSSQLADGQLQIDEAQKLSEELKNQLDESNNQLASINSTLNEILGDSVFVKATSVYNCNSKSERISYYISSDSLQFLCMDYKVYSTSVSYYDDELYVKVISPDGELRTGSSSPSGYTFSETLSLSFGTVGWGNSSGGSYNQGLYVFQFFYNDELVGEKAVVVN